MNPFASIECELDLTPVLEAFNLATNEAVQVVFEQCYNACPVNTGYMRSTLQTEDNSIYVTASYAPYTEYRTGWFSNAVQTSIPGIKAAFNIR